MPLPEPANSNTIKQICMIFTPVFYLILAILKLEMCPWDTDAPAIAKFV